MTNKIKNILILLLLIFSIFIISCTDTPDVNPHLYHIDDNQDGLCDECGKNLNTKCTYHIDDDHNNLCDVCGESLIEPNETLSGYYILSNKLVTSFDQMNAQLIDFLYFDNDICKHTVIDYKGVKTTDLTYTLNDNNLIIKNGILEYNYVYSKENNTLSFDGILDKKKTTMTYVYKDNYQIPSDTGMVSFYNELFGDDINENFYNYCPTIMMEGNNIMHIYYCSNKDSGNVTDYIAYRKGILHSDGLWTFSEKELVLEPGKKGEWDSRHTCDPSVVKGEFKYNNRTYSYLMAYLGCSSSDCTYNEVGIAVANNPSGPWLKVGDGTKPFVKYVGSTDYGTDGAKYWGYGQPSLVSVDKKGQVVLFYTKGIKLGTFTYAIHYDLSNINDPIIKNEGKLSDGGAIEILNNADFSYDPVEKRIYCIKEDHINNGYPSDGGLDWLCASSSLFYIQCLSTDESWADCLFRNNTWAKVGVINEALTGSKRNHNCGIMTDEYGWIMNFKEIPIVYTVSSLMTDYPNWSKNGQWPALHTYRLYGQVIYK